MRKSIVKAKLAEGKPVTVVKQNYHLPWVTEMLGKIGFDCIWACLEHLPTDVPMAANMATAARAANIDLMLRAARGEYMRIGRMLESGATGIMLARIDNLQEAKELVTWGKFPPLGRRGVDAVNADADLGLAGFKEYLNWANRETFLVVQIESQSALDCCEEIAGLEGVDVVFLGPGDLSLALGMDVTSANFWKEMDPVVKRVANAATKAGKAWGMPATSKDRVKELLDQGARFISYGADCILAMQGFLKIREELTKLGFEFELKDQPGIDNTKKRY